MEGRRSGTASGDLAARRIADWLAAAGLRPGGDQGTYLQTFVLETSSRPGPASRLDLLGPTPRRLEAGREWTAHGGSRAGEVSGDVVFVGYGAEIPEAKYDDYAGVDVRGKIALALDGAPAYLTNARVSRLDKLIAAQRRGPAALLIAGGAPRPRRRRRLPGCRRQRFRNRRGPRPGARLRGRRGLEPHPGLRALRRRGARADRLASLREPARRPARSHGRDGELRHGRPAARAI